MTTCGVVYFVWSSTIGKGDVVELPIDLRKLIYEMTFPRVVARCCECDNIVLLQSLQYTLFQTRSYTVRNSDFYCMICKQVPKKVSLLRKMFLRGYLVMGFSKLR